MKKLATYKMAITLGLFSMLALPAIAFAQEEKGIMGLVNRVNNLLNILIPLVMTAALFVFLWNLFIYLAKGRSETERAKAREFMLTAILIFFVMTGIWGIIALMNSGIFGDAQVQTQMTIPSFIDS